jgi:hypothetical protein
LPFHGQDQAKVIASFVNRRQTFLLMAVFLTPQWLLAATIKPGGNIGMNETWMPDGSPYVIQGDLIVPVGAILNIQAGVEVQCAPVDAQAAGRDPARVELIVRGTLNVNGTANSPVTFNATGSGGAWYGIIIATGGVATIVNGTIQRAVNGLTCESLNAIQVNNVTLFSNQTALVVAAGTPVLNQVRAYANQTAMNIGGSGVTINYSAFHANAAEGIQINSSSANAVTINHCTLHTNGAYGVFIGSTSSAQVILKNSLVSGHGFGVYKPASSSGTVTTTYSVLWNGTNFGNAVAGTGVIVADPGYIDVNGPDNVLGNADDRLYLKANSPCIAGAEANDDIGAYVIPRVLISPVQFSGNDVRVRFISVSNQNHQLEHTEDFVNWTPLGDGIFGTGSFLEQTHGGARALPRRFYRVRIDY